MPTCEALLTGLWPLSPLKIAPMGRCWAASWAILAGTHPCKVAYWPVFSPKRPENSLKWPKKALNWPIFDRFQRFFVVFWHFCEFLNTPQNIFASFCALQNIFRSFCAKTFIFDSFVCRALWAVASQGLWPLFNHKKVVKQPIINFQPTTHVLHFRWYLV